MGNNIFSDILVGTAVGDSFGLGLEFVDRDVIRRDVDFTRYVSYRKGKYAEGYEPGYYSDDTEHTIGVVQAIMDDRKFSEELLLEIWESEHRRDTARKGHVRQGHGIIKALYSGDLTIEQIKDVQASKENPGCAPPMRATMIGFTQNFVENATINATVTHPHPMAIDASVCVAAAAHYLTGINSPMNKVRIISHIQSLMKTKIMKDYLQDIRYLGHPETLDSDERTLLYGTQPVPGFDPPVYGVSSSAMHVVGAALNVVFHSNSAFAGLQNAVRVGGDVDSVAAISCGILSGMYGINSFPDFLLEGVEGRERLENLGNEFLEWFYTE